MWFRWKKLRINIFVFSWTDCVDKKLDIVIIILSIDDCTFIVYLNTLINCDYVWKCDWEKWPRGTQQRKSNAKYTMLKNTLCVQVSGKTPVVLVNGDTKWGRMW